MTVLRYLRRTSVLWKRNLIAQNICERLIPAFALERGSAEEHLID